MRPLAQLIGESPELVALREQVARLLGPAAGAGRRLPPLLILGETGTGKGLLASAIHRASGRAAGPFVDVNCAAIPETLLEAELFGFERGAFTDARQAKPGLFQVASGGTIFLDEVGLLPFGLQAKLLKVIEERQVRRLGSTRTEPLDACVVAATGEDLPEAVRQGRFRADLYHRLAVVTLALPPLRARGRDVVRLAEHFLGRVCEDYGLPDKVLAEDAHAALLAHDWPGNVRELANVVERAALLTDERLLTAARLGLGVKRAPRASGVGSAADRARDEVGAAEERRTLLDVLRTEGWNFSRAAARLGVPRNTLRYRVERLGLEPEGPPGRRRGGRPPARSRPTERVEPVNASRVAWPSRRVTFVQVRLVPGEPERATAGAGRALEGIVEKIRAFGGRVEEVGASGLLATFGLVDAEEDAPRRAASAALAVRQMVARAEAGRTSRAAVAIHTAALALSQEADGSHTDAGDREETCRLLAALLERAEPGTVVASLAAARVLAARFDLMPLELADGTPAGACRILHQAEPGRMPFVGREHDLRLLLDRFQLAQAGHGQGILIMGEPGIGKSRLLRELRHRLGATATWVEGQALPQGASIPFHPVVDMLRRVFRIGDGDPAAAVIETIEAGVRRLGADLGHVLPPLRYLLDLDAADPALGAMDPGQRHAAIVSATHLLLERGAELRPHVLVLEDAHWADAATAGWVTRLVDNVGAKPIVAVVTARPGYRLPFDPRIFETRLALSTLPSGEILQIARNLVRAHDLPSRLQALAVEKAEGNPFFLEELMRSLQEQDLVRRVGDRVILGSESERVAVPDTIEDVILARIRRLDDRLAAVLAAAAVIGKDVPIRLLGIITGRRQEELDAELRRLHGADFLYERRTFPEPEYTFKHALTHEVAYDNLAPGLRRTLHARIAEALETMSARHPHDQVERLASHAVRGEAWRRAVPACRRAGLKAFEQSANREAVAWLEQALDALAHLPRGPETIAQAIDIRCELRSALLPLGEMDRVERRLAEAETLATAAGDRRRLGWVSAYRSAALLYAGQLELADVAGRRAVRLAEECTELGLDVVARTYRAVVMLARGDYRETVELCRAVIARVPGALARERFGQVTQPAVLAAVVGALALAEQGEFAEASLLAGEALDLAEATGGPYGLVIARLASAQSLLLQGAVGEAEPFLSRTLGAIEARELPFLRPWALALAGRAHALAGRPAEAVPLLDEAIRLATAIADVLGYALWLVWLGHAHLLADGPAEAARLARQALAWSSRRGERGNEAWALQLQAEAAARTEPPDLATARGSYEAALARAVELGMRPLAAECQQRLGRIVRAGPTLAEAREPLSTRPSRTGGPRDGSHGRP
jgi:DNA-binding NtrC family response regulator/tetratricopeptide (TPR) repeat protein